MNLMKNFTFALLVSTLPLSLSWAQSKTIGTFIADENGEPNDYIQGEFTNELTSAKLGDIREGRYVMRQRYEDPFDADEVAYNLYSGKPGANAAKLNAFTTTEIPIKLLAKKKFYTSAEAEYDDDVEAVYFDGKYAYTSESTIFIHQSGSMIALTQATNALTPSSTGITPVAATQGEESGATYEEEPYNSEETPEQATAEDADFGTEESDEVPDIAEASETIAEDNSYNQYAADENMEAVYDRFGYGDDIQEYIGYSVIAGAGALLAWAVLKHTTIAEAQDVISALEEQKDNEQFRLNLDYADDPTNPRADYLNTESGRLWEGHYKTAQQTVKDRESNRNLIAGAGLLTGVLGGVLLTVDF